MNESLDSREETNFPHEIIAILFVFSSFLAMYGDTKNACWSIQNSYHINLNPKHSNTSLKLDKGNHLLKIH